MAEIVSENGFHIIIHLYLLCESEASISISIST